MSHSIIKCICGKVLQQCRCMDCNKSEKIMLCDSCADLWRDRSCSCHINPPCSYCENNIVELLAEREELLEEK